MITVAALYVDERGPYVSMPGVDAWGVMRDASRYSGPYAVVAHPPCGPWGSLKHLHRRVHERELAIVALAQVRRWGGVLEHPAHSGLFRACNLPAPGAAADAWGGFTIQVDQVSWGHVARKRTWLYIVGVSRALVLAGMRFGGLPTHWVSGGRNPNRKGGRAGGGLVPPGIKVCSAQQRRRTPIAFAEWLVSLARSVEPVRAACGGEKR